jgi:hypothetical protein
MFLDTILSVPALKKRINDLEQENQSLKKKLSDKQEQINKTNAYWKGQVYKLKRAMADPTAIAI